MDSQISKAFSSEPLNNPEVPEVRKRSQSKNQKSPSLDQDDLSERESDIEYEGFSAAIELLIRTENASIYKDQRMKRQFSNRQKEKSLSTYQEKSKKISEILKKTSLLQASFKASNEKLGPLFSFFVGIKETHAMMIPHIDNPDFDPRPYLF